MVNKFVSSVLILFVLNCAHYVKYIPDPQKDVEKWLKNFEQQNSFSFRYEFRTLAVHVQATGDCVIGRAERVSGTWNYGDSSLSFDYIGLGDIEYTKEDHHWRESARGEESDNFTQIMRLLTFDKFEYLNSPDGYTYRFKANMPFLAPGHWKELIGVLKISKRTLLPITIWAGLPDSSVYWQTAIDNYNRIKSIRSPMPNDDTYLVSLDGKSDLAECFNAIRKRLSLINIDYRLDRNGQDILLKIAKHNSLDQVKAMLAPGHVSVYGIAQDKKSAALVAYFNNDLKRRLLLTKKLFGQDQIKGAKLTVDALSKPHLVVSLKKKLSLPSQIALEIDSLIIGLAMLDTDKKIDRIEFDIDMHYYELEIARACLEQTLPVISVKPLIEEK